MGKVGGGGHILKSLRLFISVNLTYFCCCLSVDTKVKS